MKAFEALALCIGRDAGLIADVLGREVITVRRWKQDPHGSGSRSPLDSLEMIMETALQAGRNRSDALAPLVYLQRRFMGEAPRPVAGSIHGVMADVMLEESHLAAEYSAAIRDGKISPDERRRLQREVAHIRERLEELEVVLQACE